MLLIIQLHLAALASLPGQSNHTSVQLLSLSPSSSRSAASPVIPSAAFAVCTSPPSDTTVLAGALYLPPAACAPDHALLLLLLLLSLLAAAAVAAVAAAAAAAVVRAAAAVVTIVFRIDVLAHGFGHARYRPSAHRPRRGAAGLGWCCWRGQGEYSCWSIPRSTSSSESEPESSRGHGVP